MRIYISGERKNTKAFLDAYLMITERGHNAIDPTQMYAWGLQEPIQLRVALALFNIKAVDAVFMLKGWQDSITATAERDMALNRGIVVEYQSREDREKYLRGGNAYRK